MKERERDGGESWREIEKERDGVERKSERANPIKEHV